MEEAASYNEKQQLQSCKAIGDGIVVEDGDEWMNMIDWNNIQCGTTPTIDDIEKLGRDQFDQEEWSAEEIEKMRIYLDNLKEEITTTTATTTDQSLNVKLGMVEEEMGRSKRLMIIMIMRRN